ncbi:hypothetical protein [Halopelagius longus]|uniref:Uncharacterized protein n=1 Tax=Halopelagius longus TaxID=1236180 RepID=A0A1H1G3K0_9EURY|nr:hypothetical protein [Halopelagius longus]RDI69871.1 hypothetical protein DWB78_17125 [Halopelagius longus]SDR07649.1 hypothetical protein SAMN05216278_3492 [Halopelagius longus]
MSKQAHIRVEDESVFLSGEDRRLDLGSLSDLYDLVGGESYTIEYDERAASAPWVETDDDRTFTFEVREAIDGLPFGGGYAERVADASMEQTESGVPERTEVFADVLMQIWDSKGNPEELAEFHE